MSLVTSGHHLAATTSHGTQVSACVSFFLSRKVIFPTVITLAALKIGDLWRKEAEFHCNYSSKDKTYYLNACNKWWPAPADQYCLARLYDLDISDNKENGNSVSEFKETIIKARQLYKTLADKGWHEASKKLCRPSMFLDWDKDAKDSEMESICCPPDQLHSCPWHAGPQESYQNDNEDSSTYNQPKFFVRA